MIDFHRVISRITYKPNTDFRVHLERRTIGYMVIVDIRHKTIDSHTGLPTEIHHSDMQEARVFKDDKEFVYWVRHLVSRMEDHESDEWFKLDKVMLKDPHEHDRKQA